MKADLEGWTVVLQGGWNLSILTPQWLAQNLFKEDTLQVEVVITPANKPELRYRTKELILMPSAQRLVLVPTSQDDAYLLRCESVSREILRLLPHTPIAAYGINFRYIEENDVESFSEIFDFDDTINLGDFGASIKSSDIKRQMIIDEKVLNLQLNYADRVVADFNFHKDVSSAAEAADELEGRILDCKQTSLSLMSNVYKLELDQQLEPQE
jgi:hypothetical protein